MPKIFENTSTKKLIEDHLKVVNQKTAALWATECTEHIVHYFERQYPEDDRPRKAITAGRAWVKSEIGAKDINPKGECS